MKITRHFGNRLVEWGVVVALVLAAGHLRAASDHQGFAKVRYVVGSPTYSKGAGTAGKVERYMVLHPGDTVNTAAKDHVDLALGNNNGSFQVTPSSACTLQKLTYKNTGLEIVHDTQLDLKSGSIAGIVNRMATGSKYEIKTPKGIAGIRGTRYQIWANGDLAITDGRGAMALTMPDGSVKPFTVDAGKKLVASVPQIVSLTKSEIDSINSIVGDAMSHGGFLREVDPNTRRFFEESQQEPYVSPTSPQR